jgi:hypothetical protein
MAALSLGRPAQQLGFQGAQVGRLARHGRSAGAGWTLAAASFDGAFPDPDLGELGRWVRSVGVKIIPGFLFISWRLFTVVIHLCRAGLELRISFCGRLNLCGVAGRVAFLAMNFIFMCL